MRIGIVGCAGRMGRFLVREVCSTAGCELAGGSVRPGSAAVGEDVAALAGLEPAGLKAGEDAAALFRAAEAVIDFTVPAAAEAHARLAAERRIAFIVGTTGLAPSQQQAIAEAAKATAVVQAANMSLGINLLLGLAQQVAHVLGEDYDIEVLDAHHRKKVDAPSGTALALGRAAAAGRAVDFESTAVRARVRAVGARRKGSIGLASLQAGEIPGEHTVFFLGQGERVELAHRTATPAIYARGAVRAALWAKGRPPGLYSMREVLGFK